MSPAAANLLAYCRAGFEKECAQELAALARESGVEGFVKARPESAFALFHPHDGPAAAAFARRVDGPAMVFPRQVVRCGDFLADLPVCDRVSPIVAAAAALGSTFRELVIETPDSNDGKALAALTAEKGLSQPRIDEAGKIPFPFATEIPYVLPEKFERGGPYPVEVLFTYYTNPLFSIPESKKFRPALEKVPFIVSFSPFMDETTMMADLVLPDGTYFERWQDDNVEPGLGFPMFGLRSPAILPSLYDVRNTGDVLIEIAKGLGGSVARSFPWKNFEEALKDAINGVFETKRGSIKATDFDEFWKALIDRGGWWDQPYVVELEPAVAEVARRCALVNRDALRNPRLRLFFGDAREHLLVTRERYDLVVSKPSNPYRTGIASLFSRDFYRAAATRLEEGGLFLQWIQSYEVHPLSLRSVYATLAAELAAVETWQTLPGDLMLVASRAPRRHDLSRLRDRIRVEPFVSGLRHAWRTDSLEGLFARFVADPASSSRSPGADSQTSTCANSAAWVAKMVLTVQGSTS